MKLLTHRQLPPTANDAAIARLSGQRLSRLARTNRSLMFRVEAEQEQPIELPARAVALLMDILEAMAAGRAIVASDLPSTREVLRLAEPHRRVPSLRLEGVVREE